MTLACPPKAHSGRSTMVKYKCDSCWTSEQTFSHLKNSQQRSSALTILALARAFGCDQCWLVWPPARPWSSKTNHFAWLIRHTKHLIDHLLRFSYPLRCFLLALHRMDIWSKPKRFGKLVTNLIKRTGILINTTFIQQGKRLQKCNP